MRTIITILSALSAQMILSAQGASSAERSLYVVTASPTVVFHSSSAATLHRIDPTRRELVEVRLIVPDNVGAGLVWANDAARMIVIGSPPESPKHFDVIDMGHPARASSFELSREGLLAARWFFALPPSGEKYFLLEVMDVDAKPIIWIPLAEDLRTLKQIPASWDLCRFANLTGYQGWGDRNTDRIRIFQFDDGRLTFRDGGKEVTKTDWFLPKEHRFPATTWILLLANNADILALSGADRDRPSPAKPWLTPSFLVRDKRSNQWSTCKVLGDSSETRAFGSWIAVVVQNSALPKTGAELRRGNNLPRAPMKLNRYMEDHDLQRPGILYLYNGHTRQYLKIETRQPDSEVILIEDNEVYYRVKQVIWRAKITAKGLSSPVLVADNPAIVDVHWAFWGPTETPIRK